MADSGSEDLPEGLRGRSAETGVEPEVGGGERVWVAVAADRLSGDFTLGWANSKHRSVMHKLPWASPRLGSCRDQPTMAAVLLSD